MNHLRPITRRSVCFLAILGCGNAAGPDAISVGGTYSTAVTLGANTCGPVTVQPLPTTVVHTAGDTAFTLVHGPVTYRGTLAATGAFTTAPQSVSGGVTSHIQIAGRFTVTGFTATVTVDVVQSGPSCQYVVAWVGTRTSGANVIP